LLGFAFEVVAEFIVELALNGAAAEKRPQPEGKRIEPMAERHIRLPRA
jgi:hypothetical protein